LPCYPDLDVVAGPKSFFASVSAPQRGFGRGGARNLDTIFPLTHCVEAAISIVFQE
jgi:hypothetical protein